MNGVDVDRRKSGAEVAVIGAGISGLTCATTLADHGINVSVLDKGRGAGGRMSTRRTATGYQFDHGCQYFTVRDPQLLEEVAEWEAAGIVAPWAGRIVELDNGAIIEHESASVRYVGTPGMNAICKHLANGLPVQYRTQVTGISLLANGRLNVQSAGSDQHFDAVVVTVPAPQATRLLVCSEDLAMQAASCELRPCWSAMVAFAQPVGFSADGAFVKNSQLAWVARNSSKPQRETKHECWVLHASSEWSAENVERDAESAAAILLAEFFRVLDCKAMTPTHLVGHRWRFANTNQAAGTECLFDAKRMIAAAGDWCKGNRVEAAFLSGRSAAVQMIQQIRS